MFEIKYLKNETQEYVYQNSWGFSTRAVWEKKRIRAKETFSFLFGVFFHFLLIFFQFLFLFFSFSCSFHFHFPFLSFSFPCWFVFSLIDMFSDWNYDYDTWWRQRISTASCCRPLSSRYRANIQRGKKRRPDRQKKDQIERKKPR